MDTSNKDSLSGRKECASALTASAPASERLHIVIIGKRNSGKSTLVNALTGQETSVVSAVPGTTTDPVRKAMEIPGIGPCLFIDTAGIDDNDGSLGKMRVERTMKAVSGADIAIFIFTCCDGEEKAWYRRICTTGIPVIPVLNPGCPAEGLPDRHGREKAVMDTAGEPPVILNALTGNGIEKIYSAISGKLPAEHGDISITGSLAKGGDTVLLVMPQDMEAPKGRLILPQVQTIRELLDKKCTAICCTPETMDDALRSLTQPPHLIITDSQAFQQVWDRKPEESMITSFSILFAGYKGDIRAFMEGAEALGRLSPSSHVLIAEACTHAPASEDIGRVKIPEMLRRRFGDSIRIDIVAGTDFPDDLTGYDIVIHCGACMFSRKLMMERIASARRQNTPITNYGMTIAWAKGILGKVAIPVRQESV